MKKERFPAPFSFASVAITIVAFSFQSTLAATPAT